LSPEGPYGVISVRSNSSVKLHVRLVHSGTDEPAMVRSLFFSFFDFGRGFESDSQSVIVHSFQTYIVAPSGYVHHEPLVNGVLLSSTARTVGERAPANPLQCSEDQMKRTAIMLFENISEFPVELTVTGGSTSREGRDFIFGGRSCLTEHCGKAASLETKQVTTTMVPESIVGDLTSETEHDCVASLSSWKVDWSYEKKAWCCENELIGCYDCSKPDSSWTGDNREFCCKNQQIGCQPAQLADESLSRHGFDCQDSLLMWKTSWSFTKKDWCCKHETLGCYDCSGSDDAWLADHREFCCKSQHVGCIPEATSNTPQCAGDPESFNLQQRQRCCETLSVGCFTCAAPNLGWTPTQIEYCCRVQHVGCELSTPSPSKSYDCQDGLADWQLEWSEEKKNWCCTNQAVGCANNLSFQKRFMQNSGTGSRNLFNSSGTAWVLSLLASLAIGISIIAGVVSWSRAGTRRATVAPGSSSYTPASELLEEPAA